MAARTRRTCFLLLRAPTIDGVRAEAARHIWGQYLDSPNFTIAYNVLLQAGIYANVLMENTGFWKPRPAQTWKRPWSICGAFSHWVIPSSTTSICRPC